MDKCIYYVAYRYSHHSSNSGYDKLSQLSANIISAKPLSRALIRNRIMWWIANGVLAYDRVSLATELKTAWHMLTNQDGIYHILYGERIYHYLGFLNEKRKNRLIATFHQPPSVIQNSVRLNWHIRQLSAVVCVGRNQLEFFERITHPDKVFFVPHGVDTEYFTPPESFNRRNSNLCLFVGDWLRDFVTLRSVIELVAFQHPDIQFTVVTPSKNRERIGYHPNLILHSNISDAELLEFYRSASVLVMPCRDFTASNAILEGMSCGLPLVVTDVGAIRDYAHQGFAIFTPLHDARYMADEVLSLLNDPLRCEKMSEHARKQALNFAWSKVFEKMFTVYEFVD